jgi:hypothetical protein
MPTPEVGLAKSQVALVEKLMKNVDARSIGGALLIAMVVVMVFTTILAMFNHTAIAVCILVFGLVVIVVIAWLAVRLGVGLMDSRYYDSLYERSQRVSLDEPVPSTEGAR